MWNLIKALCFTLVISFVFISSYSYLEGAQGRVLRIKKRNYLISMGSNDGMMKGERVLLFARHGFEKGRRTLLAVLIVKKVSKNRSWAFLTKIANRKYVRKYPSSLRSAVAVFGSMSEKSYQQVVSSRAPKGMVLLGGGITSLAGQRLNQYMPEYDTNSASNTDLISTFDSEMTSTTGYHAGVLLDVYPLAFFKSGFIWEIFGLSLNYVMSAVPITITPHHNPEISLGEGKTEPTPEEASATWLNASFNLRFPLTVSSNLYFGTVIKVNVLDTHMFNVADGGAENPSDIRSLGYEFLSLSLEENISITKWVWLRGGASFPIMKKGSVQPESINIDKQVPISYDAFNMLSWFGSLGFEVAKAQLAFEYRSFSYTASTSDYNFETNLNYSLMNVLLGYSF